MMELHDIDASKFLGMVEETGGRLTGEVRRGYGWSKYFIQNSEGHQIGRATFLNGKLYHLKNYKRDDHREIDETDFIFLSLEREMSGLPRITLKDLQNFKEKAESIVATDLRKKLEWREHNPRMKVNKKTGQLQNKRRRLEGLNPRLVFSRLVREDWKKDS
jgi:hypothetical protein